MDRDDDYDSDNIVVKHTFTSKPVATAETATTSKPKARASRAKPQAAAMKTSSKRKTLSKSQNNKHQDDEYDSEEIVVKHTHAQKPAATTEGEAPKPRPTSTSTSPTNKPQQHSDFWHQAQQAYLSWPRDMYLMAPLDLNIPNQRRKDLLADMVAAEREGGEVYPHMNDDLRDQLYEDMEHDLEEVDKAVQYARRMSRTLAGSVLPPQAGTLREFVDLLEEEEESESDGGVEDGLMEEWVRARRRLTEMTEID